MKNLKLIETSIIGFFIGVVISVYILFVETSGRDIGNILNTISLTNFINYFPTQLVSSIVFIFMYYVVVHMIYVISLILLFRIHKKVTLFLIVVLLVLMLGIIFQQIETFKEPIIEDNIVNEFQKSNLSNDNKKYFGEEVKGDLNQDGKDDVAFLIKRNDGDERGDMYYLSSSLKVKEGYKGLNLLYVGEKISIKELKINEGIIILQYAEIDSEEIIYYKAKVTDNKLIQIIETEKKIEEVDPIQ